MGGGWLYSPDAPDCDTEGGQRAAATVRLGIGRRRGTAGVWQATDVRWGSSAMARGKSSAFESLGPVIDRMDGGRGRLQCRLVCCVVPVASWPTSTRQKGHSSLWLQRSCGKGAHRAMCETSAVFHHR